jgi:hypothetical protein
MAFRLLSNGQAPQAQPSLLAGGGGGVDPYQMMAAGAFLRGLGDERSDPFGGAGAMFEAIGKGRLHQADQARIADQDRVQAAERAIEMRAALGQLRDQEEQRARTQDLLGSLPPEMRAAASVNPQAFAQRQAEQMFAQPDAPKRYNVGGALVDEQGNVVYRDDEQDPADIKRYNVGGTLVDEQGKVVFQGKAEKPKPELVRGYQKDYDSGAKEFLTIKSNFNRFNKALDQSTKSGDATAIFNLQKIIDPTSVTRESEVHLLGQAGGLTEQAQAYYDQWTGQGRLTDLQRYELRESGRAQMIGAVEGHQLFTDEFAKDAAANGLDPEVVTKDYLADIEQMLAPRDPPKTQKAAAQAQAPVNVKPADIATLSDDDLDSMSAEQIQAILQGLGGGGQAGQGAAPGQAMTRRQARHGSR